MAETTPDKQGFLSRLFGRKPEPARPETPEAEKPEPAPSPPVPSEPPPSPAVTGASDLVAAPPTVTEASPDTPPDRKVAPELTGADLQPIEGISPEGTGPREPVPRVATAPEPTPSPAPPGAPAGPGTPAGPGAPAGPAAERKSWWRRLTDGMRRTSSSIGDSVTSLFFKRKLDAGTLEDLEDVLVQADLGVETASRIAAAVGAGRYDKEIAPEEVKAILAAEVEKTLAPVAQPLAVDRAKRPFVILVVGVNGAGKTTTIGKLAQKFRAQKLNVTLAAGDTFRAAAIDQLKVWGERTGVPVIARPQGSDAAGLAFDALTEARASGADVLMVDTAGRLQNKAGLMAELEKIVRVMRKIDESAPHATLLVLDATVGQNAVSQVELFRKAADVTGLVMTKLDGTARGGILVALAARFGLPVHFIGVGESVDDLEPFAARDFARAIAGLDE